MTEISEAARAKAREVMGVTSDRHRIEVAFARFIQEVSDACKAVRDEASPLGLGIPCCLAPYILPEPVDPLTAAFEEAYGHKDPRSLRKLRDALAKRGLKIVEAA